MKAHVNHAKVQAAYDMVWVAKNAPNYLPDGWAEAIVRAYEEFKANGNPLLFVTNVETICAAWGPLVSIGVDIFKEDCNDPVAQLCGPEIESRRRSKVLKDNYDAIEQTYLTFVAPFKWLPAARG